MPVSTYPCTMPIISAALVTVFGRSADSHSQRTAEIGVAKEVPTHNVHPTPALASVPAGAFSLSAHLLSAKMTGARTLPA